MKNLAALYIRLENNLEIAGTSRDTGKTPLINYVIGNNKKRKNLREETRITRIHWNLVTSLTIVTSERAVSYNLSVFIDAKEKKVIFRKHFSKFRASDNSDLQIKMITVQ